MLIADGLTSLTSAAMCLGLGGAQLQPSIFSGNLRGKATSSPTPWPYQWQAPASGFLRQRRYGSLALVWFFNSKAREMLRHLEVSECSLSFYHLLKTATKQHLVIVRPFSAALKNSESLCSVFRPRTWPVTTEATYPRSEAWSQGEEGFT